MFPLREVMKTHPLQLLISTIDYDDYVGRIGVGRIERGVANRNRAVTVCASAVFPVRQSFPACIGSRD